MRPAALVFLLAAALTAAAQQPALLRASQPLVAEWAPDGKILVAAGGLLARFDLDSDQEELLDSTGLTFALSRDGTRLALAGRNRLEIRRYADFQVEATLTPSESANAPDFTAVAWSPDGETLAAGRRNAHVLLWDAHTGEQWADLAVEPPSAVSRLAFSADGPESPSIGSGRLLTAFEDGRAILWDVENEEEVQRFEPPRNPQGEADTVVIVSALSPDGRRVLTTRVRLGHSGDELAESAELVLLDDAGQVLWRRAGYGVEFTRDGAGVLALTPPFRIAALYRAADAGALSIFEPPESVRTLYLVRQSPDGAKLLAIGEDESGEQVLVVWDFATARVLKTRR